MRTFSFVYFLGLFKRKNYYEKICTSKTRVNDSNCYSSIYSSLFGPIFKIINQITVPEFFILLKSYGKLIWCFFQDETKLEITSEITLPLKERNSWFNHVTFPRKFLPKFSSVLIRAKYISRGRKGGEKQKNISLFNLFSCVCRQPYANKTARYCHFSQHVTAHKTNKNLGKLPLR